MLESVSSGPKTRKLRGAWLSAAMSRRNRPSTLVSSEVTAPGEGTVTAWVRKSGIRRSRSSAPPLVCGLAPMRRSPFGASSAIRGSACLARRTAPPPGSCASSSRAGPRGQGGRRSPGSAPGARGTCPRSSARRVPSDPSSPSASAARSSASAGATGCFFRRGHCPGFPGFVRRPVRPSSAISLVHDRRVVALDEVGGPSRSRAGTAPALAARCGRARSGC